MHGQIFSELTTESPLSLVRNNATISVAFRGEVTLTN